MNAPFQSLAWEIWRRGRRSASLALGLVGFCAVLNLAVLDRLSLTTGSREVFTTLFGVLMALCFLFLMGALNCTEYNSTRDWNGFPYRLFTLPVRTWQLVAAPMLTGVAAVELVYLAWVKLVWTHREVLRPEWFAVVLGAYVVFYQTTLWCLAGFRIVRILALGLGGVTSIAVASLPFVFGTEESPWFSAERLMILVALLAAVAAVSAWAAVARQRCGGGRRQSWLKFLAGRLADALPARKRDFASPAAAQFWFEWRRTGWLFPVAVFFVLAAIIAPLSWVMRSPEYTLYLLNWIFALPVILAAVIGKGFSKPDFWSRDLALPSFLAVRPLSAGEIVVLKMKVAAGGAALAWLLVLGFLALWLPLWANLKALSMARVGYWMVYDHSVYPQYLIAALLLVTGMFVTWKCFVGGLWIGLSGSRRLYYGSAAAYCVAWILLEIGTAIFLANLPPAHAHFRRDLNPALITAEWIAAAALMAKFWLAVSAWRGIHPQRIRRFVLCWCLAASCLVGLAILLWGRGTLVLLLESFEVPPMDPGRLRNFFILLALLIIPFARLGLAPSSLAGHRRGSRMPVAAKRAPQSRLLVGMAAAMSCAAVALALPGQKYERVDAGGHQLRMLRRGATGPTVVFEAGAGGPLEAWTRVQPAVSAFARTIAYDRAGNGLSPAGTEPREGVQIARELHTALHNAGAAPPYLLVGHSLGGPYIRVFAGLYSDEVAGLVLVDPTQEELLAWAKGRDGKPVKGHPLRLDDEVDCAPATFTQAQEHPVPTNLPVILITGQGPREIPGFLTPELRREVQKDQDTFYPAKLRFHREWVEKFPAGQLVITEKSGHGIPYEEPEIIVSAIRRLVEQLGVPGGVAGGK